MEEQMKEMAIAQDILTIALDTAGQHDAKKVKSISVLIGEMSDIESESLMSCFEKLAAGTIAEQAELKITPVPIVVYCHECKKRLTVDRLHFICAICGSTKLEILTGDGLQLEDLDLE